MNTEKIEPKTFNPGDRAYRWKLWMKLDSHQGCFHHLFWKRICLVAFALAVAGWLVLAAGGWAELRVRRGISRVRYVDLVLPWRWDRCRKAIGAQDFALGSLQLEAGNPNSALASFRAALALVPDSLEIRRRAARADYILGLKSEALALLKARIATAVDAGNETYLRDYFEIAFDLRADDEAYAAGLELLPRQPDTSRVHRLIALAMATARYNRGYYLESEQILGDWGLQNQPEGDVLVAQCEFKRGLRLQAVGRLDADLARFANRDLLLVALERLFLAQGRPRAVRQFAFLRAIDQPMNRRARVDLICADHVLGRNADVSAEITAYCADFKGDAGALALLSQFAANTGDPATASRVREMARRQRAPIADFDLRVAQANMVAHDYRQALRAVALAQSEDGNVGRADGALLSGIRAVALLGAGDAGGILAFSRFLPVSGALQPVAGLFLVHQLSQAGFSAQSRGLLERICSENPGYEPALADARGGED